MTDRKKPGVAFWATVVVVVAVPVLYAAGYLVTVKRTTSYRRGWMKYRPFYSVPIAHDRQDFWRTFFSPAHAADRRIRPSVWPNDEYGRLHSERMAHR